MPARLEISVVVSTYQRPRHLERCLASLAAQRGVDGQFEIVVVDDGSRDETERVVADFARTAPAPVKFVTHEHDGFQLARCRNSGVRASAAPYILFTDGDCVFPADHLARHIAWRRPGVVAAGDCLRLDEATSRRIDLAAVRNGSWENLIPAAAHKPMRRIHRRWLVYQTVGHAEKPKLVGANMAVWREQLDRVNGFDERYRGWGCEDDDLSKRLRHAGHRVRSILGHTYGYHLWHAPHATAPQRWSEGVNIAYFYRPVLLTRCLAGLESRDFRDLTVHVQASGAYAALGDELSRQFRGRSSTPDLEILMTPGDARFAGAADRRILAIDARTAAPFRLARQATAILPLGERPNVELVVADLEQLLGLSMPCGRYGMDSRAA